MAESEGTFFPRAVYYSAAAAVPAEDVEGLRRDLCLAAMLAHREAGGAEAVRPRKLLCLLNATAQEEASLKALVKDAMRLQTISQKRLGGLAAIKGFWHLLVVAEASLNAA